MTQYSTLAIALGTIIIGETIIITVDQVGSIFDTRSRDDAKVSLIGGTSSKGLWASFAFFIMLIAMLFVYIRHVFPLANFTFSTTNYIGLILGTFILGIMVMMVRDTEAPPAFMTTIFAYSVLAGTYSLIRWLLSEVIALPSSSSDAGILLFGFIGAFFGVGMIVDGNLASPTTERSQGLASQYESSEVQPDIDSLGEDESEAAESAHVKPSEARNYQSARRKLPIDTFEDFAYGWEFSPVRFSDVGGYYDVKREFVEDVVKPIRAAAQGDDRFARFGIEPERGILLFGPPGTGKTLFARALAGELGLPFVELSPADVTSKWINEGPERIKQLFDEAASVGPCVIFIDEAEHLFGARSTDPRNTHAEDRKMTTEFLVHLTKESRDAIVVAATNRPEDIDSAMVRPGRLTAHYRIGLPDSEGRHAILQSKLSGVPSSLSGSELAEIADHTRGFTGADLESLVDGAKRSAAKRNADAISVVDFPSLEVLEERAKELEETYDSSVLPDPADPSAIPDEFDDDPTVGVQ